MVRKPRPYVPKVKGCYQCSQRRIHCDGTRPSCYKCDSKGLTCSGFGVKYRFRDVLVPSDKKRRARRKGLLNPDDFGGAVNCSQFESARIDSGDEVLDLSIDSTSMSGPLYSTSIGSDEVYVAGALGLPKFFWRPTSLVPELGRLEPWKEFLLMYFSDNIAPHMVVVDDDHNGWRHSILPIACIDNLVMSAVLAASAFHLTGRAPDQRVADPNKLYGQAIRELQHRRNLTGCDQQTRRFVILALVVLLVVVMVNGCCDFPLVFHMLQSALDAVGGESRLLDGSEMAEFSLRQIRKMRVYAAPFLNRDAGVHALTYQAQQSFDCLHYYGRLHPKYSPTFNLIAELRQHAYDIYLDRVLTKGATTASRGMVGHFVRTVQSLPEGSPGEHVLVWPVFIAASESSTPEYRMYFEQFLERQYRRNGFVNIPIALKLLKRIWTEGIKEDWPELLPEPQVFIM
ncbi:hypothetical protein NA57DRAFT_58928 [Rhizodiscina lignyota]|uniref:Zn(2)-C6 fungal-type domain-containing protein n=1 Tax=Rhizodiscina lignyota TaxID=1504668 RepID=A0A9P4M7I3_9PEZI|nr:hypothetical protein NA57DRAFT_58928 [Rhizodiscina lignyota]